MNEMKTTEFLGINFWSGSVGRLLVEADQGGGLFCVPSAPSFAQMAEDEFLKKAYQSSDWAVVDGGYVAIIMRFLLRTPVPRISGLQILQKLMGLGGKRPIPFEKRRILWVMPSQEEADRVSLLAEEVGLPEANQNYYLAPFYQADEDYHDKGLIAFAQEVQPEWIILGIGGGRQEKLGYCLRNSLNESWARDEEGKPRNPPVILCTGGAIAFLSGGQASIPTWADRLYLGWMFRIIENPKMAGRYVKAAWALPLLLWRSRRELFS